MNEDEKLDSAKRRLDELYADEGWLERDDFSPEAMARRKAKSEATEAAYQAYRRAQDRAARREGRRFRRLQAAEALALVKAAQEKGLSVKRATIGGVSLEFGGPAAAPATLTPLEAWKAKHARKA